jgi:alginate O-acetyltransferase complex protein AlgJ
MQTWLRWLRLAVVGGIFAVPMIVMVVAPETAAVSTEEARPLTPAPSWPTRFGGWVKLPMLANAWLDDHFGLRGVLTHARASVLHVWLGLSSDEVLIGRGGRMFIRSNMAIEQSAGAIMRRPQLAETAAIVARINTRLRQRGVNFLYMIAPNAATIETADLPDWALNPGRPTEYDALLDLLHARGVTSEDMRPALRAGRDDASLYLHHDSHWNVLGTLIGFNVAVGLAMHPDWHADPTAMVTPPLPMVGGDLARMLGINADVVAAEPQPAVPDYPDVNLSVIPDTAMKVMTDHAGPNIVIVGDSSTEGFFRQLVARQAHEVIWINSQACGFDWNWVEQSHPDEVWWIPTERFAVCIGRPAHF